MIEVVVLIVERIRDTVPVLLEVHQEETQEKGHLVERQEVAASHITTRRIKKL